MFNRGVSVVMKAPSLNIDQQFVMQTKIVELGINLITMNPRSNMTEQCLQVIYTNNRAKAEDESRVPQLDMTLTKNNAATARSDVELDLSLKIGQIIFKYNEDLIIRAKAISRLKVDRSLQNEALDQLE